MAQDVRRLRDSDRRPRQIGLNRFEAFDLVDWFGLPRVYQGLLVDVFGSVHW